MSSVLSLLADAAITARGGATVDGILGLSARDVVSAGTPETVASTGCLRGVGTVSVAGVRAPASDAAASLPYRRLTEGQLAQAAGSRLHAHVAGLAAGTGWAGRSSRPPSRHGRERAGDAVLGGA